METVCIIVPVRGADTDRHNIAAQSSGLWAISAGLAYNIKDDIELLEKGMFVYDALYSWAKHLKNQKHLQQPFEQTLLTVLNKLIKCQNQKVPEASGTIPVWRNRY